MNPTISVIIPVYNAEKFLSAAIESVITQTRIDWELILVDDGSTDESANICDQYAEQHSSIRVIHQTNRGVSSARNGGLAVAQGEFIVFMDADDVIAPVYLQHLLLRQQKTEADLVCTGYELTDETLQRIRNRGEIYNGLYNVEDFPLLIRNDWVILGAVWGKLLRRSLINKYMIRFNERLNFGEDTLFIYCYISVCMQIDISDNRLYFYRQYNTSLSKIQKGTWFKQCLKRGDEFRSFCLQHRISTEFVKLVSDYEKLTIFRFFLDRPFSLSEMRENLYLIHMDNNICQYIKNIKSLSFVLCIQRFMFLYLPKVVQPYTFLFLNRCKLVRRNLKCVK